MDPQKKVRVLIADDEQHTRLLLRKVMTRMNCEIAGEAANGQEAIDLFRRERPHILLLDVNMPGKTGDEALKEIMSEYPDAFVIVLSSMADNEIVSRCIEIGAANYILKDTPIDEMTSIIRETWQDLRGMGIG